MGGVYPATDIFSEFNFNCGEFLLGNMAECKGSAKAAVENMPPSVKMVFSGFEAELDSPEPPDPTCGLFRSNISPLI